jgi:hypothetical protein
MAREALKGAGRYGNVPDGFPAAAFFLPKDTRSIDGL